jgi:hypothetical protein
VEYALLTLRGPTNIEKKVRELQSSLYRQGGLISARALPVLIPLCFVRPDAIPAEQAALRDILRRAVGRDAPYLNTGPVAESDGFLFWELSPRSELQRLRSSCEEVFAPAAHQPPTEQPDLFPVARGFFLCALEGQPPDRRPPLPVPESQRFPAKAAFLLLVRPLEVDVGERLQWWKSLYWEKLDEIPLRKTGTTDYPEKGFNPA